MTRTTTGTISTTVKLKDGRFFVGKYDMTDHINKIDPTFAKYAELPEEEFEVEYEIDLSVSRNHGTRETPDEIFFEVSEVWVDNGLMTKEMVAVFGEEDLIFNANID